jgi:hypothetical protein
MRTGVALLLTTAAFALGCAAPVPTPAEPSASPPVPTVRPATASPAEPSETFRHGPAGLVDDLVDAGAEATVSDSFDGTPLANEALVVCVNRQDVRVFVYASEQERAAASAQIDPSDPSHVGLSIIEWDGWPKLWQRDRIIVQYLGSDPDTIELLTELLGDPFAVGLQRPQRLRAPC